MREYLFRGLRDTETGGTDFVYGNLSVDDNQDCAYYETHPDRIHWRTETGGHANAPVRKGTVGQYTGINDRKGSKIFEGDIVKVFDINRGCLFCGDDDEHKDEEGNEMDCENFLCEQEVKWNEYSGYFADEDTGEYCPSLGSDEIELEIVGNKHITQGTLL